MKYIQIFRISTIYWITYVSMFSYVLIDHSIFFHSQFFRFATLWLDGLFRSDCLILEDLQVLFVLCRWRTTDTKSSHRTNTTGLMKRECGPEVHYLSCEDPCWKGQRRRPMWNSSWNSLKDGGDSVKLLVTFLYRFARPEWWRHVWTHAQGGGAVRACHMWTPALDIMSSSLCADRLLQHPQLHAEHLSRWCMGNVAGAKPGIFDDFQLW